MLRVLAAVIFNTHIDGFLECLDIGRQAPLALGLGRDCGQLTTEGLQWLSVQIAAPGFSLADSRIT